MKGFFVTFEGGEGSGKSTIINKLKEYYTNKGLDVCLTREPGGVKIAEQIRNVILDCDNTDMNPKTEAILYAASRVEHLDKKVIPALEKGNLVLCDRYLDSSLVYQGYARGLGIDRVMQINMFAADYLPDVTFFFDIKPIDAFKRIKANNREENRLDLEKMDFHEKVYAGYDFLQKAHTDRIIRIDANRTIDEVLKDIINILEDKLYGK